MGWAVEGAVERALGRAHLAGRVYEGGREASDSGEAQQDLARGLSVCQRSSKQAEKGGQKMERARTRSICAAILDSRGC
jgi:hypothetical protein